MGHEVLGGEKDNGGVQSHASRARTNKTKEIERASGKALTKSLSVGWTTSMSTTVPARTLPDRSPPSWVEGKNLTWCLFAQMT